MTTESEIDEVLRRLGDVEPPSGLERRISVRLQMPRKRFSMSVAQAISVCALAAGIALSAVALNPKLRNLMFPHHSSTQGLRAVDTPRVVAPAPGGFGTASAVHVPVEPVPVQPTPANQGRGRSRSGRAVLPNGALAPLPRGVASRAPLTPQSPPSADDSTQR
jgi:hypothetical protein